MIRAFVSDIHIGHPDFVYAHRFINLLTSGVFDSLVIVGDLLDFWATPSIDRIIHNNHEVYITLNEIARHKEIIWVLGNHDMFMSNSRYNLERFPDVKVFPSFYQYQAAANGKNVIAIHGHEFDDILQKTHVPGMLTSFVEAKIFSNPFFRAQYRTFVGPMAPTSLFREKRQSKKIENVAQLACSTYGQVADVVILGHFHIAHQTAVQIGGNPPRIVQYYNTGTWVKGPDYFPVLIESDGEFALYNWLHS